MTSNPSAYWPSDEDAAHGLDRTCDRFEAAWQAVPPAAPPSLSDFLPPEGAPARVSFFRELLAVELYHRRRAGLPIDQAEYVARFPELAGIIAEACSATTDEPSNFSQKETRALRRALDRSGLLASSSRPLPVRVPGYEVGQLLGR